MTHSTTPSEGTIAHESHGLLSFRYLPHEKQAPVLYFANWTTSYFHAISISSVPRSVRVFA